MLRFCLSVTVLGILFSARINQVDGSAGNVWTYRGALGPDHWHLDYPHCGGVKQSPISVITKDVVVDTNQLEAFEFTGYDELSDINMTLENNGHTVQVDLNQKNSKISKGGLVGNYVAQQFHFHWGAVDSRGSEHDINGVHYPMEMHIVHYNEKYGNISHAIDKPDGLAVLGFFFKVGRHNEHFENIIFNFDSIRYKNHHTEIRYIPLIELIPPSLSSYYRYLGSLTTPPCYESVTWTLFNETIEIAEYQLEKFRTAIFENDESEGGVRLDISDDYRPIQCLFRRKVYASHPSLKYDPNPVYNTGGNVVGGGNPGNGSTLKFTTYSLLFCLCVILLL